MCLHTLAKLNHFSTKDKKNGLTYCDRLAYRFGHPKFLTRTFVFRKRFEIRTFQSPEGEQSVKLGRNQTGFLEEKLQVLELFTDAFICCQMLFIS